MPETWNYGKAGMNKAMQSKGAEVVSQSVVPIGPRRVGVVTFDAVTSIPHNINNPLLFPPQGIPSRTI